MPMEGVFPSTRTYCQPIVHSGQWKRSFCLLVCSIVLFRDFSASGIYYQILGKSIFIDEPYQWIPIFFNCFNFLKWKQLFRMTSIVYHCLPFIRLVETDSLFRVKSRTIFLLVETIIGLRVIQFLKEELIFANGQLILCLTEIIHFFYFSETPASESFFSIQWKRNLQQNPQLQLVETDFRANNGLNKHKKACI